MVRDTITRRLLVFLASVVVANTATSLSLAQLPIRVVVNERVLRLDQSPEVISGRVLVPLRGIFEEIGAFVRWKGITRTVVVIRSGSYVSLRVGERTASVRGTSVPLDVPARVVGGRVLVPLRFIGEALGAQVSWRAVDRTVVISTRKAGSQKPEQPATVDQAQPITGTQPPPGLPPSSSGEPVAVERGRVVITPDRAEFRAGDHIGVTVANGLDRTIYSDDFKTDCSIVTLERRAGWGWERITGCALGRPTMTVAIGSGRGRTISIDPRSMHLRKAAAGSELAFGTGTYRFTLAYRVTAQPSQEQTAYSPIFAIR